MNRDGFGDSSADSGADLAFERELLASAAGDGVSDESVRGAWSRFAVTLGATATLAGAAAAHGGAGRAVAARSDGVLRWISVGAAGGGVATAALMAVLAPRAVPATGGTASASLASAASSASAESRGSAAGLGDEAAGAAKTAEELRKAPGSAPGAASSAGMRPLVAASPSTPRRVHPAREVSAQGGVRRDSSRSVPPPRGTPAVVVRRDTSSALAAEIALLDEAQRARSAGQYELALAVLARYQREHPRGELRRESEVLKLETLAELGERQQAADLARHFLEAFPDDPHATYVQTFAR